MIPLFKVFMAPEAPDRVREVLESGFIGEGEQAAAFEREFAPYVPAGYDVALTNSCTSAIHMVLAYLGVGPGDEVITTALTCVATNAPILSLGARPVWADVNWQTGLICPYEMADKISPRTKAIIAVDWTGMRADYRRLKEFGIPVIQDAAHGPLDISRGNCGDFICYSFGPIKHLTSGEGGAVASHPDNIEKLRIMRWYGLDRTSTRDFRCAQDISLPGLKWHMNDVNAAIGRANLPSLRNIVANHVANAGRIRIGISHPDVEPVGLGRPSNSWVLPLRIGGPPFSDCRRDEFKAWMGERGVMCSQVHARNDKHTAYKYGTGKLIGLNSYDQAHINVPCGWWMTPEDVDHVLNAINDFPGNRRLRSRD
jgi:dTDP-4-amino-4,6-dideoxygalactose transaminase